jgi:hypothetical protein
MNEEAFRGFSYSKDLAGHTNVRREFQVSTTHDCVQYVRQNIREDMEDIWVTNLSEDRKRFYLVSSLLDPHTEILSFCDNRYFPSSWKDDALRYLSMELKSFYVQCTRGRSERLGWTSQAS